MEADTISKTRESPKIQKSKGNIKIIKPMKKLKLINSSIQDIEQRQLNIAKDCFNIGGRPECVPGGVC